MLSDEMAPLKIKFQKKNLYRFINQKSQIRIRYKDSGSDSTWPKNCPKCQEVTGADSEYWMVVDFVVITLKRETHLKSEDHVELLPFKPGHGERILGHC